MSARLVTSAALGAIATLTVVASATGPIATAINLPQQQSAVLSGIDVPITGARGQALIESAFGAQPLSVLIEVARDVTEDPGIRLRAYRAIGLYPTTVARLALTADLDILSSAGPGTDLLYLRAAIEALGEQGEPNDVATLVPLLDFEASRDIRAATADALRSIGSSTANGPLHDRLDKEDSRQVRLAIARALRDLGDIP